MSPQNVVRHLNGRSTSDIVAQETVKKDDYEGDHE